jgi:hypothetical protein
MTAFDNLRVGTRLGANPQIMITTTPKRVPLLYSLLKEAEAYPGRVKISRGSTLDNAGNLSSTYLNTIVGVYEGTRLAAQELFGEMLNDVEGALWVIELIERSRESAYPIGTPLRIIGVDPSVAENPRDACGIVVCASTGDRDLYKRHAWILEDATIHGSPETWANKVVEMARKWSCPVVAEVNQGGALVRNAINAIDPNVKSLSIQEEFVIKHGSDSISAATDTAGVTTITTSGGLAMTANSTPYPRSVASYTMGTGPFKATFKGQPTDITVAGDTSDTTIAGFVAKLNANESFSANYTAVANTLTMEVIAKDPSVSSPTTITTDLQIFKTTAGAFVAVDAPATNAAAALGSYAKAAGAPSSYAGKHSIDELKNLFTHYPNIKLAISGHIHLLDRVEYNGVTYCCNGAVSGAWWGGKYHDTKPGYAIIDLYSDGRFTNTYSSYV